MTKKSESARAKAGKAPTTKAKAKAAAGARSKAAQKSGVKAKGKPRGKPIQKGQVLNPGGRPKLPEELKAAFRAAAPEALEVLEKVMRSTKAAPAARIKAAEVILNRGYGTPTQSVELTNPDGSLGAKLTHEQALERLEELRAEDA
jgi:hypothetical protein